MIWVRGQIVADDSLRISVLDRSFEHGLGLFETFRTWGRHPTLLPRHLDRLARSARELGIRVDQADLPDRSAVETLLGADGREGDAMLRITVSGGTSTDQPATLWMRSATLPAPPPAHGCAIGPARPARTDPLAGHKTLNYWPNRLMYDAARTEGFDECLTLSPDGHLWEGSRTNLFVVVDGQVLTPPCATMALPGIMRGLTLEWCSRLDIEARETPLGLFDPLFKPDEVFLTNSVRGIMAVGSWGEARFPAPGPVTGRLWEPIRSWLESGGEA